MDTPTSDTASEVSAAGGVAPSSSSRSHAGTFVSHHSSSINVAPPQTLLFVRLAPDVSRLNLATFYYAVIITIASYTFVNSAQKIVLTEILGVDDSELGQRTGDLGFYSELVIMACVTPWGFVSDRIGRKAVYMFAFAFMATGFYLTSYATTFEVMIAYRLIYAIGAAAAAAMLTSVLADYVVYADKGRASGIMGFFSGCGALLAALILLRIPEWLDYLPDYNDIHAAYIITGTIVLLTAVAAFFGLQGTTSVQREFKDTMTLKHLKEALQATWDDPELALAYGAGFVARGDSVVLTTFLSLWIQEYVKDQGESSEEALAQAGMITGIAQTCALIFSLVAGYVASRIKGVVPVLIMSFIATIGYASICLVSDPTSSPAIFCACIIGVGEIGVIVVAQALASRRAPAHLRGSVGGLAGMSGSIGILVCNKVGGLLYDTWLPAGPFVLFAGFNALLFVWALAIHIVRSLRGQIDDDTAPQEDLETYERLLQAGKTSEDTAAAMMRAGSSYT